MFDDLQKQPDDIFAETDKSAPQVAPPTMPASTPAAAMPAQAVMPTAMPEPQVRPFPETSQNIARDPSASQPSRSGGYMKTILLLVGIIVVIAAAFFISMRILRSQTPVTPLAPAPEEKTTPTAQPAPAPEVTTPTAQPAPAVVDTQLDTDKDGLPDVREAELGTDPLKPDTDGDGLFDREEVEVYKTNPLSPDTDGDSYTDGMEVKGGYNPNGPGKLLELPATK